MELGRARGARKARDEVDGLAIALLEHRVLRLGDDAFMLAVVGVRDAVLEVVRVDAEPLGEPLERLRRWPRLAGLDLADVLLRHPLRRELGLRQPAGIAQSADAVAEAALGGSERRRRCGGGGGAAVHRKPRLSVCGRRRSVIPRSGHASPPVRGTRNYLRSGPYAEHHAVDRSIQTDARETRTS